ncbi:MAG: bifunctional 2-polyprenyl-6-hydroxyphenol methylase/3-demethylubiquinol 3-O-methyltransferase UbiG [Paracoccaceae bacterium]|nr:bifunctional 2-polyprenyl-6-hydroxyphenol methylase/3-demethylubiquinol 3-O-methyltransferase UbiG [Paracoccaceae bacterium]
MSSDNTIDNDEVLKFQAMAEEWWDPSGKFKPLHMLNPCRLQYITEQISWHFELKLDHSKPFKGLEILDIGCGGGLLSEPMARMGAQVLGADVTAQNIPIARAHANQSDLTIDYKHASAQDLANDSLRFDVILNMEVIEHVANPSSFLETCSELLKPNGLMICSTINRNMKSYVNAIIGAEYIMRWLPKGTHDWSKFLTPDELKNLTVLAGLKVVDIKGFSFNKLLWKWSISTNDLDVNYVVSSVK